MSEGLGFGRRKLIHEIVKHNWEVEPSKKNYTFQELLFVVQELLTQEGKPYFDTTVSRRGFSVFKDFAQHLLYRNLANYDSMLLLTSDKGTGKSSAAIMIARQWCKLLGIRFNPNRHIAYTNADVMNKIDLLNPFEPLVCLSGKTLIDIEDKDGKKYKERISKLEGKNDFKVLSYNKKKDIFEYKKPKECVKTGSDYVYEIELENGIKISATENHMFLLKSGEYKKLKDLKEEDEIVIKTKNCIVCNKEFKSIKSIKKINKTKIPVFDIIGVKDNGNFVANNMVVHNCDEAVEFASSENWAKKENKDLKKKLAQVRTKHLLFILCFPLKVYKLDKTYLESFVNYWCLKGDTKILTRDINGVVRQTPIKDLNKRNPEVLTYNLKTKNYEFKEYDKKIKTKKDAEIFELKLENGLKIECTEDHPFLTQRGWVRLKDLKNTDNIEVKTNKCKYCDKDFIPKKQQQVYCCKKCNNAFNVRTSRQYEYNVKYRKTHIKENKKYGKEGYEKNKDVRLLNAKTYREENKDYINNWAEQYRKENVELLRKRDKKYRENNRERYLYLSRKKVRRYRKENINFKISQNLRNSLRRTLKAQNAKKTCSIFKYLGCSIEFFKEHISKQFVDGMTWNNWGMYTWHIDHTKPCSHFDLSKESERRICFNYKNQKPMWATDNLSKGDRYVG